MYHLRQNYGIMRKLQKRYLVSLKSSDLFSDFSPEEVGELLELSEYSVETHSSGELLMQKDSSEHILGIMLRGTAAVKRIQGTGQMHMSRLSEGDLFGAASLFCEESDYVVDIRCTTDCRTVLISEKQLVKWMQDDPRILKNYLRYLTGRIRFLNQRLDALTETSVCSRIMTYLENIARDGDCCIKNCQELAEALCLSRATLYRALDTLCKEGKIIRKGKQIILMEEV